MVIHPPIHGKIIRKPHQPIIKRNVKPNINPVKNGIKLLNFNLLCNLCFIFHRFCRFNPREKSRAVNFECPS